MHLAYNYLTGSHRCRRRCGTCACLHRAGGGHKRTQSWKKKYWAKKDDVFVPLCIPKEYNGYDMVPILGGGAIQADLARPCPAAVAVSRFVSAVCVQHIPNDALLARLAWGYSELWRWPVLGEAACYPLGAILLCRQA